MGNKNAILTAIFSALSLISCGVNVEVSAGKSAAFISGEGLDLGGDIDVDNGDISFSSSSQESSTSKHSESSISESTSSEVNSSESSSSVESSVASSESSVSELDEGPVPVATEQRKLELHYCTCSNGACDMSGSVWNDILLV